MRVRLSAGELDLRGTVLGRAVPFYRDEDDCTSYGDGKPCNVAADVLTVVEGHPGNRAGKSANLVDGFERKGKGKGKGTEHSYTVFYAILVFWHPFFFTRF